MVLWQFVSLCRSHTPLPPTYYRLTRDGFLFLFHAYGHGCQSPQLAKYCLKAGCSEDFEPIHSLALATSSCSCSKVSSPERTRLRKNTKYVSNTSHMQ